MKTIIWTGGIACGKSSAVALLKEKAAERVEVFDCDACVRSFWEGGENREELEALLGAEIFDAEGRPLRELIREEIFRQPAKKQALEALIHPFVRKECLVLAERTAKLGVAKAFIIDIPLFYESAGDYPHDLVVVISASSAQQKERLVARSAWSQEQVDAVLALQWPLAKKEKEADVVLWNGADLSLLENQIQLFIQHYL